MGLEPGSERKMVLVHHKGVGTRDSSVRYIRSRNSALALPVS